MSDSSNGNIKGFIVKLALAPNGGKYAAALMVPKHDSRFFSKQPRQRFPSATN